jgi:hypothetical protein
MHRIEPFPLWLGHAGDLRNPALLFASEIRAIVDLAANEPFSAASPRFRLLPISTPGRRG